MLFDSQYQAGPLLASDLLRPRVSPKTWTGNKLSRGTEQTEGERWHTNYQASLEKEEKHPFDFLCGGIVLGCWATQRLFKERETSWHTCTDPSQAWGEECITSLPRIKQHENTLFNWWPSSVYFIAYHFSTHYWLTVDPELLNLSKWRHLFSSSHGQRATRHYVPHLLSWDRSTVRWDLIPPTNSGSVPGPPLSRARKPPTEGLFLQKTLLFSFLKLASNTKLSDLHH